MAVTILKRVQQQQKTNGISGSTMPGFALHLYIRFGSKLRLPSQIDFNKSREEIAVSLNEFCKQWCGREHVECNALNSWTISIFNIIEKHISFYSKSQNLVLLKLTN